MYRIAFITDIHLDKELPKGCLVNTKENWKKIIEDLKSKKISRIVLGGDIAVNKSLDFFFKTLKGFDFDLILGNHDNYSAISKFFSPNKYDNELYYYKDENYYRFIFLDTSAGKLSTIQLNWLTKTLKTTKEIILFIHHPVIKIQEKIDKLYPLKNRMEIKNVLKKAKKSITIFCGHYHMNDERTENNIKQIITQSTCFQVEKGQDEIVITTSNFGYRIIEIDKYNISTTLVNFKEIT
ncbi:metallophosphoesterase family protein [Thalassobellus citreus]|uniref:metallophosphoesterase family protein n=1 Tax=Thalassobellus citreus TaxID=3367752 RepID=UPI0037BB89E4